MKLRFLGKIKFNKRVLIYTRDGYLNVEVEDMKHRPKRKTAAPQETGRPEGPQPLGEPNPRSGGIPNIDETMGEMIDRKKNAREL